MLGTCLDECLGAWDYYQGWFCSCYNWVSVWTCVCLSLSLRVCVCVCVCFLIILFLTGVDSLWTFCFLLWIVLLYNSIIAFFILFYSSSVFKPNPVFNLAPSSVIVSNKLTWFVTNCCVYLSIICEEHARWQNLCRSWLQRHHQSLAMRICLPFRPGTSGKNQFHGVLSWLLLVCDSRVCEWLFLSILLLTFVELCCVSICSVRQSEI